MPIMIDYFYKFSDQQTMFDLLLPLNMAFTDEENNTRISQGNHQYAACEVGLIPGIDGWHLNVRLIDPTFDLSTLTPFQVTPQQPYCVWA
jgi:hypothetical protein